MKKRKLLYLFPLAALILSGCSVADIWDQTKGFFEDKVIEPVKDLIPGQKDKDKDGDNKEEEQQHGGEEGQEGSGQEGGGGEEQQQKQDFVGLSLNDATFTYDGQEHSISVSGNLPAGATVSYGQEGNTFVDVGEHEVTATVSADGYNTLTLHATLTIVKATFTGLSLADQTVTYDGAEHSLEVTGTLPTGATVNYGASGNSFTNVGVYEITAIVSATGYEDLTLSATLTIEKAEMLGIVFENETVTYDGQPHSIEPVIPEEYAGAQVSYGASGNSFTSTGTHEVNATISLENYNDWTGTAYLTIADAHFAGLSLQNSTVTYNGQKQTITLTGDLPAGATAEYVEGFDGGTMPGEYTVKIRVSAEGYEDLILVATLTIESANFEGITFESQTVTYDGSAHSIAPSIPALYAGATVTYGQDGNSFTDVGTYEVTATVSMPGYNDWQGNATLTISPATFAGLSLNDTTVDYDGNKHTIALSGDLPTGATFTYDEGHDGGTDPGTYVVSGTVSAPGYTDLHLSATLTIQVATATESFMVADFENLTDNDLVDDFTFEYYNDGWVTPSTATITVAENQTIGTGSQTLRMNMSHQGSGFKVTKHVTGVNKKYSGIALNTLIDNYAEGGTSKVQVQLWVDNLPLPDIVAGYRRTYVTWTLENECPSNWTHWEIPFDDESISIASGAVTPAQLEQFGLSLDDLCTYITDVAVIVTPSYVNGGPKSYAYIDDVELIPAQGRVKEQHVDVTNKTYTIASTDDTVFKLTLNNGARFETLNLEQNVVLEGTYTLTGDELTLAVSPDSGTHNITFKMKVLKNGAVLEYVDDPSGDVAVLAPYAAHIDFTGKAFSEVINVDDFSSYATTGQGYDRNHSDISAVSGLRAAYYGEVYNENKPAPGLIEDKWNLINDGSWTTYINLESNGYEGQAMSLTNNGDWQTRYMTFDLAKGGAKAYGRNSTLSFFVKGSVAQTMKIRVYYVDRITAANQSATSGDCKHVENIPVTADWTQVEIPLEANRLVYGFMITPTKANGRIFVDEFKMYGEANPYATYVEPQLYETINDGLFGVNIGDHLYSLELANNVTTASISLDGAKQADFTAEMNEGKVTLKDVDYAGAGLTVVLNISSGTLEVESASGQAASSFTALAGATFVKLANLKYDFQKESTSNHALSDSNWLQQYAAGNSWTTVSNQMNVRSSSTNVFCNMTCGNNSTVYRYTYQPEGGIGLANHFHVDLANNYSSIDMDYKIILVYADDSEHYLAGDADNFVTLANGEGDRMSLDFNDWVNIDEEFAPVSIKAVRFVIKCAKTAGNYGYLYFDNLEVDYKLAEQPEPQITYANINYDLQDKSGQVGGQLNDSQWTQKYYGNSGWVDTSGKMNVRNSGNNVFCNMAVGYGYDYVFTYTPTSGAGVANYFSVDLGNDYSGAQDIKVKVKLILADDSEIFIVGDSSNYVTIAAGLAKFQNFEVKDFGTVDVKAIKFVVKSAMNGNAYLYFDNIVLKYVDPSTPEPQVTYANISYDLQDKSGQVGNPLSDAQWTQKYYGNSGWVDTSGKMNVRNSGDNVFCNMAVGYSMDYVFTFTPTSGAGVANHFSVDLANDFSGAQDIKVKVKIILADSSEVFIVGDGSNYVTIPANAPKWQNFETSFTEADVIGVKFIVKSNMNGNAYLYFDNLVVNYVD